MAARRSSLALCIVMVLSALTACSHTAEPGQGGIAAGTDHPAPVLTTNPEPSSGVTLPPSQAPAPGTTTPSAGHTTKAGSAPTSKTTHPPKSTPPTSTDPADVDYAIAWSNADCRWFINTDGTAYFQATMYVSANVLYKTGTIKALVSSNGGGVPSGGEIFPASSAVPPRHDINFETNAPAADFQSHSITFTANLTFVNVPDQLDTDNSSKLLVHFPTTLPPTLSTENLVCDHVFN